MCHKSKGNKRIEVNKNLNHHKAQTRDRLQSERGLYHRSKRSVEVEAVFGQLKSNNKFTRFTMRGLDSIAIEFGLMALGHNLRKWAKRIQNQPENSTHRRKNNPKNQNQLSICKIQPFLAKVA